MTKTITKKLTTTSYRLLFNKRHVSLLFFCVLPFLLIAQDRNSISSPEQPLMNKMFFKISVSDKNWHDHYQQLDAAFRNDKISLVKLDSTNHYILVTCPKGCVIEDVKRTLSRFDIGITSYREAYTNREPNFFE